jgi:hypothetical protein
VAEVAAGDVGALVPLNHEKASYETSIDSKKQEGNGFGAMALER